MLVIPALGRLREEDHCEFQTELKFCLNCKERSCVKKDEKTKTKIKSKNEDPLCSCCQHLVNVFSEDMKALSGGSI